MGRKSMIVIRDETCWTKDDIVSTEQITEKIKNLNLRLNSQNVADYAPSDFNDYHLGIYRKYNDQVVLYILSYTNDQLKEVQASIEKPPSALPSPTSARMPIRQTFRLKKPPESLKMISFHFAVLNGNDTFRSFCEGSAELKLSWTVTFEGSDMTTGLPKLIQDRLNLLESGNHSDVVFKVGDQEIKAHKCILSSQSEYFQAMFESGMQESRTNVVVIEDFSAELFNNALRFIYTGRKHEHFNFGQAFSLLPLADMYQLSDLAKHCVDKIKLGFTAGTVEKVLSLAVQLNQTELKSSTFSFLKTMAEKDRWKILNGFEDEMREDFLSSL